MSKLFSIEVFYNKVGSFTHPDHHLAIRYHSFVITVWAESKEDAESKFRSWFFVEKPEQKIIQLLVHQSLE